MKKPLQLIPLLACLAFTSCDLYYDMGVVKDRLDALEYDKIATISEQIGKIEKSIVKLEATEKELDEYIKTLEEDVNNDVSALKKADTKLEGEIASLREYVDTELKAAKDWASATFATLEQYNSLATELATTKSLIEQLKADMATELTTAISALETSMKEWVNEQLTGYYTIAEIDAKITALETTITEGNAALQKEIDTLKEELATQKTEITEAYTAAITEAITTNNGVIDEKIATEIAAVNEKITALETRLTSIEERLSAVEDAIDQIKALDITFDTTDNLACMAGASITIGYTITGGDSETAIEAWGDGGWSAEIVAESATSGKVKVTAPREITKQGKVVVLATSGAGGVSMKTIRFDEGVLTGILDTYEVDWEACTLSVTLKTNLTYTVTIPAEAQSWLSIAEGTRATLRTETITLSVAENPEEMPARSAIVSLVGECGDVLQSFEVAQQLRPSSSAIEFADQYVKKVCVERFDTNGDGELSELEASRVTSLGNYNYQNYFFGDYTTVVKSFDELRYFTNLKSISQYAFNGCSNLSSITIPDGVTSIGDHAFYNCSSLTSITIPDGVTVIGRYAFYNCNSLTSITIPESVISIGYDAFTSYSSGSKRDIYIENIDIMSLFQEACIYGSINSNVRWNLWLNDELLTEYTFPDGTVNIDIRLKGCTSVEKVVIPDGVVSISNYAFEYCSNLRNITIPESVLVCGQMLFAGCTNLTCVNLPNSITEIGYGLFSDCSSLVNMTIPDSVTSIGGEAFRGCTSLSSITIPDSVTEIGERAFQDCSSLESVTIGNGVTSIGDYAFGHCSSLESITIPDSVTEIGDWAFSGCYPKNLFIKISDLAKYCDKNITLNTYVRNKHLMIDGSEVTELVIPDGVTSIGNSAFSSCSSLESITIPDGVTSIGISAFSSCSSLASITIGDGVTSIGDYAFSDCSSLASITIPDSVTEIGIYAFYNCSSLESVTIGDGVTLIGDEAFSDCSSLAEVYIKPTTPPIAGYNMFNANASGRKIYVPTESVEAYKAAEGWSSYASSIVGYDFE